MRAARWRMTCRPKCSPVGVRRAGSKPAPLSVIANRICPASTLKPHADLAGAAGMLAHVRQRLLYDAHELHAGGRGQDVLDRRRTAAWPSISRRTARPVCSSKRATTWRSVPQKPSDGRLTVSRLPISSRMSPCSSRATSARRARLAWRFVLLPGLQIELGSLGLQVEEGQALRKAIVQLLGQLLALLQRRLRPLLLQQLRLRPALLGHIAQQEQVTDDQPAEVLERGEIQRIDAGHRGPSPG